MLRKFLGLTKQFLWKIDMFSSSQLLRYKTQNSYSTLTGGFLSLVIILIFGTILITDSVEVATKQNIIAQDFTYFKENPTYASLGFDDSSNFMFGVGITGMNLSDPYRYFDITMKKAVYSYGQYVDSYEEPLQQCQYNQWAHINKIGANSFNRTNMSAFLCPTSNLTLELEGKFSSKTFRFLSISIGECHNETEPSRPCADASTIDVNRSYGIKIYFMNPYVNSGIQNPVRYYFQDRNYLRFTPTTTTVSNLYFTDQVISTDNSLMPWSDPQNQTILQIKQTAQVKYDKYLNPEQSNKYVTYYFRKSPYCIITLRSYRKMDELFSTIGGLFGFAVALFFCLNYYTEGAFQIEMGDVLFHYKEDDPLKADSYNIFFHAILFIYQILKKFNIQIPWKRMKAYSQCREEVVEQLDVSLLMNKVTFLEKCMNVIFEEHQFRAIYLQQKPNVKQAKTLRINHGINKIVYKNPIMLDNKIKERVKKRRSLLYRQSLDLDLNQIQNNQEWTKRQTLTEGFDGFLASPNSLSSDQLQRHHLIDAVFKYIMKGGNDSDKGSKISQQNLSQKEAEYMNEEQASQFQKATEQHQQSLRFVHTALSDMRQIEVQAKEGNKVSQRIYKTINNDITKDQIIILQCLTSFITQQAQMIANAANNTNTDPGTSGKKTAQRQFFEGLLGFTQPQQPQARINNTAMATESRIVKEQEQQIESAKDIISQGSEI